MGKTKLSEQQIEVILKAFREVLERGPWANSALLRTLGKKLQAISDAFEAEVGGEEGQSVSQRLGQKANTISDAEQEVFVALYSSDGANIRSWEHILSNLPRQVISRPIYEKEDDIKRAIKARENQVNEGYVVIYINKQNKLMMPEDRTPKDRLGAALLTLKDKALSLDKVVRFVHVSGTYHYVGGRLIKDSSMNVDS